MNKSALGAALGAAFLTLAACADSDGNRAEATGDNVSVVDAADGTATASASFPKGTRIIEEDGVTFRIDPDGTRVRLGENDSRIVVENGVRFRVDPDGSRVRIDETGVAIDVPDVDVDLPDVDVGINRKGNPDIDVRDDVDVDVNTSR